MSGLVITKTKSQRGLLEPITRIRKPYSIQEEMGEEQGTWGEGEWAGWPWYGTGRGSSPLTLGRSSPHVS